MPGINNLNVDHSPPLFTVGLRRLQIEDINDFAREEWYYLPFDLYLSTYYHFQRSIQYHTGSSGRLVLLVSDGSQWVKKSCNVMHIFDGINFVYVVTPTKTVLAAVHESDPNAVQAKQAIMTHFRQFP